MVMSAFRLAQESDRADAAERQIVYLSARVTALNNHNLQLRADLAKSNHELQLWKVQLDLAQKGHLSTIPLSRPNVLQKFFVHRPL
jgi:hypothetical protein